jgi:hypothetical protein
MIILRPIGTAQALKFIPRVYEATRIVLVDESTNTEVEILASFLKDKYYLTSNIVFDLIEDRFYNLTVYNVDSIVYKDKIFCTTQQVLDYSINKDVYTSNVTDNEYIIL